MIKNRLLRSFKSVWGILLWFLLLVLLAFAWVFFTNSGSSFVLNRAMPALGAEMGVIRGSIMQGLKIDHFKLENEAMRIEADNIEIAIRWRDLWRSRAHVSLFAVEELRVELFQQQVEAETTSSSPFQLPELPVEVLIDKIRLDRFSFVQADGSTLPVQLGELALSGIKWTRESANLILDGVYIDHPVFDSLIKGEVRLEQLGNPDWPLFIHLYSSNQGKIISSPLCLNPPQVQAENKIQTDLACNLDLSLNLTGSLKALKLEMAGSGQEVVLKADGLMNIFAPLLLENLDLQFSVPNSTQLNAQVISEHDTDGLQKLVADVQAERLDLSNIMPSSLVGGRLHLSTEATGLSQFKRAEMRLELGSGSVWNAQTLSGDVDLAMDLRQVFTPQAVQAPTTDGIQEQPNQGFVLEDVIFERANINLRVGDNHIQTQGEFGQTGDNLRVDAELPKLEHVWQKIGYAAQVKGDLQGSVREHSLNLNGYYQVADSQELGQAPIAFDIQGSGTAKDLLQIPFWRGSLDQLQVKHLDFALDSAGKMAAEVLLDNAIQWQVGEAEFRLKVPGDKVASIKHQGSSQSGAVLSSIGEVKQLAVSQKLMQLLNLPLDEQSRASKTKYDDVLYDIKWNLAQSPALKLQLELQRQGKRFLPINPDIPLDIKQLTVLLEQTEQSQLYRLKVQGEGEKSSVDVDLNMDASTSFLVQDGHADIQFSDDSSLRVQGNSSVLQDATALEAISRARTDKNAQAQRQSAEQTPASAQTLASGEMLGQTQAQAQTIVEGQTQTRTQTPEQAQASTKTQAGTAANPDKATVWHAVRVTLEANKLDLYALSLGAVKNTNLSTKLVLDGVVDSQEHLREVMLVGDVLPGSQWLKQALEGHVQAHVDLQEYWPAYHKAWAQLLSDTLSSSVSAEGPPSGVVSSQEAAIANQKLIEEHKASQHPQALPNHLSAYYEAIKLKDVDINLRLGEQSLVAQGALGADSDSLILKANMPALTQIIPSLHGGALLDATLQGRLFAHSLDAHVQFTPNLKQKDNILNLDLKASGGSPEQRLDTWTYELQTLQAQFVDVALNLQDKVKLAYTAEQDLLPSASTPTTSDAAVQPSGTENAAASVPLATSATRLPAIWQVGPARLQLTTPNGRTAQITHEASEAQGKQIQSKGVFSDLSLSQVIVDRLMALVDTLSTGANLAASPASLRDAKQEMVFKGQWDVDTRKSVAANVLLERTDGSGVWPIKTPVPFDFDRLSLQATPRLEQPGFNLLVQAQGQNSHLNSTLWLDLDSPLVLQDGEIDMVLPDKTGVKGFAKVVRSGVDGDIQTIDVDLDAKHLALDKLSFGAVPPALLNGKVKGTAVLSDLHGLLSANLHADFAPDSIWNKQKLSGRADVNLTRVIDNLQIAPPAGFDPHIYLIEKADIDLQIGGNTIKSAGAFGKLGDELNMDIRLPSLADLYPGLEGGAMLKGKLKGAINNHEIDVVADYVQTGSFNAKGAQPIHAEIKAQGAWHKLEDNKQGWSGAISKLNASYQGFSLSQDQVAGVHFVPVGSKNQPEWNLGASTFTVRMPGNHTVKVQQLGSTGKDGLWSSKGAINRFVVSPAVINDLNKMLGDLLPASSTSTQRGGVIVRNPNKAKVSDLVFDLNWDLAYNGALLGDVSVRRVSGDILVPTETPFALGLSQLATQLKFQQAGPGSSVLRGDLQIQTRDKGNVALTLRSDFKGLTPNLRGGTSLQAKGSIQDIAWASVFTNDLLSLGGALDFDVSLQSRANGQWDSQGQINGRNLRIVEVENGIRLLNGTLRGSFHNTSVTIDSLHFPSVIRVVPSEWRTRQWIEENPPAQNGSLNLTGKWDIARSVGDMRAVLDHYPIIQRSDRFVMLSGAINLDAALPKVVLAGKVVADAGWASIDILDTVPTVDGDVIVLKPGQTEYQAPPPSTTDLAMNLTVDLGPRFYLVGMGLNSGLVGSINLLQEQGRLTAEGEFRTRGGAIEAYGQRLQIRRGQIAFLGNITNPTLNIEAIRTGTEVEAGLRVIGTAKNPKITLVSYPDVSEVEKLSWLIMGRGPDSSGADLALLFSVGSSLIGGEEPFYRKLGIDDIGVSSGGVGDSDNILPDRTVADSTAYRGYGESDQFFYASKKFGDSWRLSVEQALTGTGTVVRGSYSLMRHLTMDLKLGTVNGLEFVYRRFFAD